MSRQTSTVMVDIFLHLIEVIVEDLRTDRADRLEWPVNKPALFRQDFCRFACKLRLVCRRANIRLLPYTSPYLEVTSRRHAVDIIQHGLPNRASVRSLTFAAEVVPSYVNAILKTLAPYFRLERLIVGDLDSPSTVASRTRLYCPTELHDTLSEIAVITSFGVRGAAFGSLFTENPFESRIHPLDLDRLAIHGFMLQEGLLGPPGHAGHGWEPIKGWIGGLGTFVIRWMITPADFYWLQRLIEQPKSLNRLIIIYSMPRDDPLAVPLTAKQKRALAELFPKTAIIEVEPPVLEEHIPEWFSFQVHSGEIWELTGQNWIDLPHVLDGTTDA